MQLQAKSHPIADQVIMPHFHFYNDRVHAETLPIHLRDGMQERGLISTDGYHLVSFCGMQADSSGINIFLPRSCEIKQKNYRAQIKIASQLMQSIERYGRESSTAVDPMDEGDGIKGLEQLGLIKALLVDYRNNGLYSRRQVLKTKNTGKPDWKNTLSQSIPFPNFRNQPIFLDISGSKRRYFSNSEVSRIHASVIRRLDAKYAWLLGEQQASSTHELKDIPNPQGDIKYQLAILQRELSLTYSEREIYLLKQLSQLLAQDSGELVSNFVVGLQRFHHAWEYMLKQVLEHTVELNNRLPAPVYIYQDGSSKSAFERGMRVDIFLMPPKTNQLTIIDAKYYAAQTIENSPGWSDLVKQFFYAKALQTVFPEHRISNAFIFPGQSGVFKQVRMKSRQQKITSGFENSQFPPIDCYYICPLLVIDRFVNRASISQEQLNLSNNFVTAI